MIYFHARWAASKCGTACLPFHAWRVYRNAVSRLQVGRKKDAPCRRLALTPPFLQLSTTSNNTSTIRSIKCFIAGTLLIDLTSTTNDNMLLSPLGAILALSTVVAAVPVEKRSFGDWWHPDASSSYLDFGKRHPFSGSSTTKIDTQAASCDLASAYQNMPQGELVVPEASW